MMQPEEFSILTWFLLSSLNQVIQQTMIVAGLIKIKI